MALKSPLLAGVLATMACAPEPEPEPDPPDVEWEGQWLRFGRSPELPPQCAGVAPYMDRYVGALTEIFEIEIDETIDYFYVDEVSTPCESLGCVRGHSVYSLVPVQEHELVHSVRSFADYSHLFLEEGAAELWGDDARFSFRSETEGDSTTAVDSVDPIEGGLPQGHYGLAGRFHSVLMEQAPHAANALLRSTSHTTTAQELDAALEAETGRSLAEWGAQLDAAPVCDQGVYRDASAACMAARRVEPCEDGDDADLVEWVGCEDEETLGPRDGEIWKYLSFELTQPGEHLLFIHPDFEMLGGSIRIESCEGGCGSFMDDHIVPSAITPARSFDAGPGTYLLRLTLPEGTSGEFRFQIIGECG